VALRIWKDGANCNYEECTNRRVNALVYSGNKVLRVINISEPQILHKKHNTYIRLLPKTALLWIHVVILRNFREFKRRLGCPNTACICSERIIKRVKGK
jgi:hypothetical protein